MKLFNKAIRVILALTVLATSFAGLTLGAKPQDVTAAADSGSIPYFSTSNWFLFEEKNTIIPNGGPSFDLEIKNVNAVWEYDNNRGEASINSTGEYIFNSDENQYLNFVISTSDHTSLKIKVDGKDEREIHLGSTDKRLKTVSIDIKKEWGVSGNVKINGMSIWSKKDSVTKIIDFNFSNHMTVPQFQGNNWGLYEAGNVLPVNGTAKDPSFGAITYSNNTWNLTETRESYPTYFSSNPDGPLTVILEKTPLLKFKYKSTNNVELILKDTGGTETKVIDMDNDGPPSEFKELIVDLRKIAKKSTGEFKVEYFQLKPKAACVIEIKDLGLYPIVKSNEKNITSFKIGDAQGIISGTNIDLTVPAGTDVTALTPVIEVSPKAVYSPEGAKDFTSPVEYVVTAENETTQIYTVTVTVAKPDLSNANDIISFKFGDTAAVIEDTNITVTLPVGTNVSALLPTVEVSAKATYSPDDAQDFTAPVKYTVTSESNISKVYTVTVTVLMPDLSDKKDITSFKFGETVATINGTEITVTMPENTDVTALTPVIEVSPEATYSPEGAKDFTAPVKYTVTAQDKTTKEYTVTVKVLSSVQKFTPHWFSKENEAKWDFWGNAPGELFTVNVNDNGAVFAITDKRPDFVKIQSASGWARDVDITKQPILTYDITATTDYKIILNVDGCGELTVITGAKGDNKGTLDLRTLPEIKKIIKEGKNITSLQYCQVVIEGKSGSRMVTVKDFYIDAPSSDVVVVPESKLVPFWFSAANDAKWDFWGNAPGELYTIKTDENGWHCAITEKRPDFLEVLSTSGWIRNFDYNEMKYMHFEVNATTGYEIILNVDGFGEIKIFKGKAGNTVQNIDIAKILKDNGVKSDAVHLQYAKIKLEGKEGERAITLKDVYFSDKNDSSGTSVPTSDSDAIVMLLAIMACATVLTCFIKVRKSVK